MGLTPLKFQLEINSGMHVCAGGGGYLAAGGCAQVWGVWRGGASATLIRGVYHYWGSTPDRRITSKVSAWPPLDPGRAKLAVRVRGGRYRSVGGTQAGAGSGAQEESARGSDARLEGCQEERGGGSGVTRQESSCIREIAGCWDCYHEAPSSGHILFLTYPLTADT